MIRPSPWLDSGWTEATLTRLEPGGWGGRPTRFLAEKPAETTNGPQGLPMDPQPLDVCPEPRGGARSGRGIQVGSSAPVVTRPIASAPCCELRTLVLHSYPVALGLLRRRSLLVEQQLASRPMAMSASPPQLHGKRPCKRGHQSQTVFT